MTVEEKRLEKAQARLKMARQQHERKQRILNDMFKVYDRYIMEGHTQASAITQTSNETGIPRTTVYQRVHQRNS